MPTSLLNGPDVGSSVRGFELLSEIGRGSFARVYVAQQSDLANRHVVLKIGADIVGESQTLARFQHPNIVPIYSAFNSPPHGVICMPYLGSTTLQRVFQHLREAGSLPTSGRTLVDSFRACREGSAASLIGTGRPSQTALRTPSPSASVDEPATDRLTPPPPEPSAELETARSGLPRSTNPYDEPRTAGSGTPRPISASSKDVPTGQFCIMPSMSTAEMANERSGSPPVSATDDRLLDEVRRLGYADAVLWLIGRLADGLDHAHARGVLHRDLKPSNVLWADDGQPMLLDFNVAVDKVASASAVTSVGGTPEYMSPEHLRQMINEPAHSGETVDARSDIYSLGIVLHQFLTLIPPGRDVHSDMTIKDRVVAALRHRTASWEDVRRANPAITASAAAIVNKCPLTKRTATSLPKNSLKTSAVTWVTSRSSTPRTHHHES